MDDTKVNEWMKEAERDNVTACVNLGNHFVRQPMTEENRRKAFYYYKKAADLGHAGALFQVSYMTYYGDGTNKSSSESARYAKMSADKDYADAQYAIACMYKNGEYGYFATEQHAFKYFTKAAEQGHAAAQIALGDILLREKNAVNQAIFWWACAFQHGNSSPQDSEEAKQRMIDLVETGVLPNYDRITDALEQVKESKYNQYTHNPKR